MGPGRTGGRLYVAIGLRHPRSLVPAADVGLDLGLSVLAATSDGELIASPRHLRRRERHLARAQRALAAQHKGSANRAKARRKVAVQHRKVREARADHLHKTALRLVRDNQAVYVEDLAVSGLARTRLAKSVHDAGWAMLVRLMKEKAERHGRAVVKVGRLVPVQPDRARRVDGKTARNRWASGTGPVQRAGRSTTGT